MIFKIGDSVTTKGTNKVGIIILKGLAFDWHVYFGKEHVVFDRTFYTKANRYIKCYNETELQLLGQLQFSFMKD